MYQPSVKSIYKINHFANTKHTWIHKHQTIFFEELVPLTIIRIYQRTFLYWFKSGWTNSDQLLLHHLRQTWRTLHKPEHKAILVVGVVCVEVQLKRIQSACCMQSLIPAPCSCNTTIKTLLQPRHFKAKKVNSKQNKYFFCINTDRRTKWSMLVKL